MDRVEYKVVVVGISLEIDGAPIRLVRGRKGELQRNVRRRMYHGGLGFEPLYLEVNNDL